MSKKPSQAYLNAKAALLDILGDGQEHNYLDVLNDLDARGIPLDKHADRATDTLGLIITADTDGGKNDWFWHLPRHKKPKGVPMCEWARSFWRVVLADGEQNALHVMCEAEEYGLSFRAFCQAKRELGVLRRVEQVPAATLEDGSTMYRCDEYWRLPGQPMLCMRCHQQPRLFDSSWCADCQQIADDRWEQFKATHPNVVE